jgi:hypothetical protein
MKKALWVLLGVVVVAVIGVAIFLATFDADRYRPLVVEKLQAALGRPVRLGHLRLSWRGGIAVTLQQVAFGDEQATATDPFFQAETVDAIMAWRPLLKKQVEIDALHVREGVLRWQQWTAEQVSADAAVHPDRFDVRRLQCRMAGGMVQATGAAEQLTGVPALTMHLTGDGLALEALAPPRSPQDPHLQGQLAFTAQIAAQGRDASAWTSSVAGSSHISLTHWKVANLNVLREVFQRLSMLPGLVERLQSRLPASYAEKLNARDTVFESLEVPMTIGHGTVHLDALRLASDSFEMEGAGGVGLNGVVALQAMLRIDPELSAALIRSVAELQYLADANGRLELPVTVQGTLPQVSVLPDVQYVASRLVMTKAQELLGNFLQRALERNTEGATQE